MQNGLYLVRLVAEDAAGLTAVAEQTYHVSSGAKPGILKVGFVDLAVPVTGIPIVIKDNMCTTFGATTCA